jgi:hypothetical protein
LRGLSPRRQLFRRRMSCWLSLSHAELALPRLEARPSSRYENAVSCPTPTDSYLHCRHSRSMQRLYPASHPRSPSCCAWENALSPIPAPTNPPTPSATRAPGGVAPQANARNPAAPAPRPPPATDAAPGPAAIKRMQSSRAAWHERPQSEGHGSGGFFSHATCGSSALPRNRGGPCRGVTTK